MVDDISQSIAMEAHHLNKAVDFILDLSIDFKAIGPKGLTPYEIEVEILFSWTYMRLTMP